jgi:hypothetical protein
MSLGTVLGIVVLIGIAIAYYLNLKSKNPLNFNSLAEENVEFLFKSLSAIGTFIEVMNLSLVAMNSMGMDFFQAMSRYVLIGVIEVLTSFLFISVVSNSLRNAMEAGKLSTLELFYTILKSLPVFLIGFVVTGIIYLLYLESIFHLEAQQHNIRLWLLPILGFTLEFDPSKFRLIDPEWQQPISFASVFLVYTTTIFDIMLVYFLWRKYSKQNIELKKNQSKKDSGNNKNNTDNKENKSSSSNENKDNKSENKSENTPSKFTLNDAIEQLEILFRWSASDIKSRLNKVLGEDPSDKTMIHPDVSTGNKSKEEILKIMEKLIIGEISPSPSGVLGFIDLGRQISHKEKEIHKVTSPLAELEKKLKGSVWEDSSDSYNDSKLRREKKELEDKMKPIEENRDTLRMELKSLNEQRNQLKEFLETRMKRSNLLK